MAIWQIRAAPPYAHRVPGQSPQESYRAIIDALVGKSSSMSEGLLREVGIYSRGEDHDAINSFTRSLTAEQRDMLATICRQERISAIHDVLAELSWWIDCEDLAFSIDGDEVPVDESGMGLHGDFMGRLDGWPWPD